MTYDQLVAFLAVVAEGSFTRASAALHKSQPAVSKLVRILEEELGVELFDRSSYRASLTDAGRRFHERAAAVVESTQALRSLGMELAGKVEPIVRLAIEAVTPLAPVMATLRAVQQRHPAARVELRTERLAGAAQALAEGRADLALATRVGLDARSVELARFCSVRIVPVARADHPVARAGRRVPPALLREHPQIVLRDSAQGDASPSLNVLAGGLRWSVTDVAAKKEVILAGMGWGGLPEQVVAKELESRRLVALQVPEFEADTMELFVVRRRDRAHGPVASALWDELLRHAAEPEPARAPARVATGSSKMKNERRAVRPGRRR